MNCRVSLFSVTFPVRSAQSLFFFYSLLLSPERALVPSCLLAFLYHYNLVTVFVCAVSSLSSIMPYIMSHKQNKLEEITGQLIIDNQR